MPIAMQYGSSGTVSRNISGGGTSGGGGIQMALLWTNPSPTSAFSAQTVSLDLSGYDAVLVECTLTNSATSAHITGILLVGYAGNITGEGAGTNNYIYVRNADVQATGLTFGTGYRSGTASTSYCIPFRIYGIKGIT